MASELLCTTTTMGFKSLATRLASILILLSFTACGKSPWSEYIKENNLEPGTQGKPINVCSLLDANQIQWIHGPFLKTESEFRMNFQETPTFPFKVELFMPDMGHGSAPVQITAESETSYLIKKVFFIMHGFWEIRIQNSHNIICRFEVQIP